MDWKREAVEKLRDYEARKTALESIPDELARLESDFTRVRGAGMSGAPVTGGNGDGREQALLSNIVHRQELRRALKQANP